MKEKHLRAWQVILGGICGLVLTLGLARFAYTPLLPAMQAQAGLSIEAGGWLATINYLGYMSGVLLAAWIDDAAWRQRLYGMSLWASIVVTLMMGVSDQFWVWVLSRYLGGLCGAAGLILGSGLVLGWLMRAGRRPELGLHLVGLGLGIVITALGSWVMSRVPLDWARQWQGFAALGLLFLAPAWFWRPPVPPPVTVAAGDGAAPSRRWLGLMLGAYFCAGWGFVINATFTVAIVEKQPLLAGQGPLAWLLAGLAGMPAVFIWDRVTRRVGNVPALLIAFALQALGVLLPALSGGLFAALLGAMMYGATAIGIVSMTLALAGRRFPSNPGKAMARLTLGYGLAQISAPALTGTLVHQSGSYYGALWLTAGVLLAGMVLLALLPRDEPMVK